MRQLHLIFKIWNPLFYFALMLGVAGITFGLLTSGWTLVYVGLSVCLLIILIIIALGKLLIPPYYRAAFKQLQQGNIDNALELANKSIASRPRSCAAYALRAYLYLCKKQLDQAKTDAHKTIELDPNNCLGHRVLRICKKIT